MNKYHEKCGKSRLRPVLKHSHTILNLKSRQNSQSWVILMRFEAVMFRIGVGRISSEIIHTLSHQNGDYTI
jgi:hypothetical protein